MDNATVKEKEVESKEVVPNMDVDESNDSGFEEGNNEDNVEVHNEDKHEEADKNEDELWECCCEGECIYGETLSAKRHLRVFLQDCDSDNEEAF